MRQHSRRRIVAQGVCACVSWAAAPSVLARVLPSELGSLVTADYQPKEADEKGLWELWARLEREIAVSNLLVQDARLKKYLGDVTRNLVGNDIASDLRIYPVRDPSFNASMTPNGMMLVHTGLLVRVRNEAQLAAVIGHECGHYLRLHSVKGYRDARAKSSAAAFVGVVAAGATGATGTNWYDVANAINNSLLLSMFSFSRTQESEADAYGINLLHKCGYAPHAASEVWSQLLEEREASAIARKKKFHDHSVSAFSTHPPSKERMYDLKQAAMEMEGRDPVNTRYEVRRDEYFSAIAPIRQMLLDEQIKLNDPGASLYLINSLSKDGWDGVLRYNEGEIYRLRDEEGDARRASDAYAAAVQFADAPPEAHRAHGYALTKAGEKEKGQAALARYLELKPEAADAAMVRFTLGL